MSAFVTCACGRVAMLSDAPSVGFWTCPACGKELTTADPMRDLPAIPVRPVMPPVSSPGPAVYRFEGRFGLDPQFLVTDAGRGRAFLAERPRQWGRLFLALGGAVVVAAGGVWSSVEAFGHRPVVAVLLGLLAFLGGASYGLS